MKIVYGFVIGFCIVLAVSFTWYLLSISRSITLPEPVTVVIEDNTGTEGALTALWNAQVLPSRWAFLAYVFLTGQRTDIKAGTYTFSDSIRVADVLDIITQHNPAQAELQITLLEGWTNEDIAAYLSENNVMKYADFTAAAETGHSQEILPNKKYDYLIGKPLSVGLQGFLFPDTYRIFAGETAIGLVEKMLDNFDIKFDQAMRQAVMQNNRSIYDTVILASIIEKEVQSAEDKKIVAGIFWKRLNQGMRLQSDATINYITKKKTTTPSSVDLQIESAYNTYRNDGLPPAPISNPGLDSLAAAVYPIDSEYYYFLTTPEGEVKYSTTYDQHLEFRNQYYE